MKKITTQLFLGLLVATCVRADTSLIINSTTPFGCLQNAFILPTPLEVSNSFTLTGASGAGTIQSSVNASAPTFSYPPEVYFFNYSIDLSHLSAPTSHCVKLLIHFGTPEGCDSDEVWGSPASIQSATLAPFGDITFVFADGCLTPGQASVSFTMFSEAVPKTNIVTIIDDYVNPANGQTNETRINVPAIVPDIPPDPPPWLYYHPITFPYAFFQGGLTFPTNYYQPPSNSGPVDFTLQLVNAQSNGLAVSQVTTQTVQVVNGLFNLPLPFDPISMGDGSARWLSIGVRPSGVAGVGFTPLNPPLPITPTPQAFYAYTAGVVADLTPGQAVTSLNGLTDGVALQAGSGISLMTSDNAIIIVALPGGSSDRKLKTDITAVNPETILSKLTALPIESWRFTNEVAGVRHVGPMAQDFKAAFGLGESDKMIGYLDASGVALAAIQGLNQKVEEKEASSRQQETQLQSQAAEIENLKARLAKLEQRINSKKGDAQ